MIANDAQLVVVRRQLGLAEEALVLLRQDMYSKNPRNYAIFSESYIDMILQLRAEIDAYLGISPRLPVPEPVDQPTAEPTAA